jgi:hypothetical protein
MTTHALLLTKETVLRVAEPDSCAKHRACTS